MLIRCFFKFKILKIDTSFFLQQLGFAKMFWKKNRNEQNKTHMVFMDMMIHINFKLTNRKKKTIFRCICYRRVSTRTKTRASLHHRPDERVESLEDAARHKKREKRQVCAGTTRSVALWAFFFFFTLAFHLNNNRRCWVPLRSVERIRFSGRTEARHFSTLPACWRLRPGFRWRGCSPRVVRFRFHCERYKLLC